MLARDVLLIEPIGFGVNPDTAKSNSFQATEAPPTVAAAAVREHATLVAKLEEAGIRTTVLHPHRDDIPDAVFPNNWMSTDREGRLVLYPMESAIRRNEIRPLLARELKQYGFSVNEIIDLSSQPGGLALEGTGSLVLDHENRIAYASISSRTSVKLIDEWCERFDFKALPFLAEDQSGKPVYHTNVMMGLGTSLAVICLECLPDEGERSAVRASLEATGREILELDWQQVTEFAGNVLFLQGTDGECVFISQRGWKSLGAEGQEVVRRHAHPVPVEVDTIESIGGGSVRCMIAEIFLPREKA